MKRQDLLTGNGEVYPDAVGKIKRRNSDERMSFSAPPGEAENRDALVYIHKVQPNDTLAGITIKFNCQATVLRKANRMWPNDPIQSRKTIVIPADACGVKGRPVPGPDAAQEEDLLMGLEDSSKAKTEEAASSSSTNGQNRARAPSDAKSTTSSKGDGDPPWVHDSWVLLPGDTKPTEIGRLPRLTLGYFPPTRRKSLNFSEANTPSASLDIPRVSISSPSPTTESPTSSPPVRRPRPRTKSITSTFPLHGPGGVGSLGKNVRRPGPAQDGLNKLFASHLPSVAPPKNQEHFTPWTPALLDPATNSQEGTAASSVVGQSMGIDFNLENVGGAIEVWVRKMAAKASKALNEQTASQQAKTSPIPGLGTDSTGISDLIELQDDPFEIGDDEREEHRGRAATAAPQYTLDVPQGMRARDRRQGSRGKSGKGD